MINQTNILIWVITLLFFYAQPYYLIFYGVNKFKIRWDITNNFNSLMYLLIFKNNLELKNIRINFRLNQTMLEYYIPN